LRTESYLSKLPVNIGAWFPQRKVRAGNLGPPEVWQQRMSSGSASGEYVLQICNPMAS
jgi:hypothetical protein